MRALARVGFGDGAVSRFHQAIAIFTVAASVAAFLMALWFGGLTVGIHNLLAAVGLGSGHEKVLDYPLGAWAFGVYAGGAMLGLGAVRRPAIAALGMVPLGLCAVLLGGPISRVYGILLIASAIALAATVLRRRTGTDETRL